MVKDGVTAVAPAEKQNFSGREARAAWCTGQLERGNVVLLAASAFSLPETDSAFLRGRSRRCTSGRADAR